MRTAALQPRLVIASENPGKLIEVRAALAETGLTLLSAADVKLGRFPEEAAHSYEENAFVKAAFAASRSGLCALGDDSGLEVAALNGAPGLYSARYGGVLSSGERVAYLLQRLRHVRAGERQASFRCSLVVATPKGKWRSFHGRCEGVILEGPRGQGGFGYDPVFYSDDLGKTFAEASEAEKQRVSHRGRALSSFAAWLDTEDARTLLG